MFGELTGEGKALGTGISAGPARRARVQYSPLGISGFFPGGRPCAGASLLSPGFFAYLAVFGFFPLYLPPSRACPFLPRKLLLPVFLSFPFLVKEARRLSDLVRRAQQGKGKGRREKEGGRRWQSDKSSGLGLRESALIPERGRHPFMGPVPSGSGLSTAGPVGPMQVTFRVPPPSVRDAVWGRYGPRDGLGTRLFPRGPLRTSGLTSAELDLSPGANWREATDRPTSA